MGVKGQGSGGGRGGAPACHRLGEAFHVARRYLLGDRLLGQPGGGLLQGLQGRPTELGAGAEPTIEND